MPDQSRQSRLVGIRLDITCPKCGNKIQLLIDNSNQKSTPFRIASGPAVSLLARQELSSTTSVLNIILSFEEALKFSLAVDECVRKLNRYKKSTREGKRAALNLTIHFHLNRIAVNEGKLKR